MGLVELQATLGNPNSGCRAAREKKVLRENIGLTFSIVVMDAGTVRPAIELGRAASYPRNPSSGCRAARETEVLL
jgi:hypothetical protein